jgi:hypothetical protein
VIDLPPTWVSALGTLEPALASDRRSDACAAGSVSLARGELIPHADLDATGRISELALMRSSTGQIDTAAGRFHNRDSAERARVGMLVARDFRPAAPLSPRWQLFLESATWAAVRSCCVAFRSARSLRRLCRQRAGLRRPAGKPVAMPVIRQL